MRRKLDEKVKEEDQKDYQVSLDATIMDFISIILKDNKIAKKKYLNQGFFFSLKQVGRHVDTIGDLKILAENAGGFARLKHGVYFNKGRCLPHKALRTFGKKKLEYTNNVLAEYGIEPIPWKTRRYRPWERLKERVVNGMET